MNYTPLGDYVLVRRHNKAKEMATNSGIILATDEESSQDATTGTIFSFGPEVEGLKEGETVVFNEHQFDILFEDLLTKEKIMVGKKHGIYATYAD